MLAYAGGITGVHLIEKIRHAVSHCSFSDDAATRCVQRA
ncbi:hypothetical protein IMCC9480_955 [Oxalobacteraceae bacterium IMCC9480]|nr:hypothetical protein IMCC9480_955 [Oxalobacteraceae bacterium IMCC9480]